MIGKKMENALNEQIKNELDSAYLYLSMSSYFNDNGLDGMANWLRLQTEEEKNHALKILDHIAGRQGRV